MISVREPGGDPTTESSNLSVTCVRCDQQQQDLCSFALALEEVTERQGGV